MTFCGFTRSASRARCTPAAHYLVGSANDLPLVVIELKKAGVPARAAFDENLTSYKHPQNCIPALFVFNAPRQFAHSE